MTHISSMRSEKVITRLVICLYLFGTSTLTFILSNIVNSTYLDARIKGNIHFRKTKMYESYGKWQHVVKTLQQKIAQRYVQHILKPRFSLKLESLQVRGYYIKVWRSIEALEMELGVNMVPRKKISFWRTKEKSRQKKCYDRKEYDATFAIPLFIQKWIGLRLTRNDPAHVRMFWDIYYWFEHINQWVAIILDITYMVVKSTQYVEIFLTMPCVGYLVLAIAKSYKIVIHRSVFNNLVSELREMWPQGTVSEEEDRIISTTLQKLNNVVQGYFWCNNILVIIFLSPSFVALIYRAVGHDTPLILPYFYWYPFDPYQGGPWYAFALTFEDFHGVTAICFIVMGDLLFCIFLSHISMQFDLLSVRIRKLVQKTDIKHGFGEFSIHQMRHENCDTPAWEKAHLQELAAIIVRHRVLIRLSGDVEDMFSSALLLNFLNSSMIFCFCGFCSVIVEKWNEFSYKSFLFTALAQTYLLCSHGQRLIDSSQGISEALYNCLWYNSSKKVKSSILIMMYRSQKEVHVTTYGFSVINMASYATILKTAWSYLSLLLNVYK